MSAVPVPTTRKLTVAEYLAREEKADRRSEFYDGDVFAMAGASREHNILTRNLTGLLFAALRGGPCQVFVADMRVKVKSTGLYTYPDVLIVCGPPEYSPESRNTLTNPRVVIEVLSDDTEQYDRTTKFRHYKRLPSVVEYVLVSQHTPLVERYVRVGGGRWEYDDFAGLDATLSLDTVLTEVPMAEVYRGVEFPPPPPRPTGP